MKKSTKKTAIVVKGLLDYLSETDQTTLLPEVTDSLTNLFQDSKKVKEIVISSYTAFSKVQKEIIRTTMQKILQVSLPVVNRVEKKLLGGFTVQVGDWFLDASLLRELRSLERSLLI